MSSPKTSKPANGEEEVSFSSLFTSSQVLCQTDKTDRNAIIKELLQQMAFEHGIGSVRDIYADIVKREDEEPTIIGPHIAMPHTRVNSINSIVVGIATSKEGIAYTESNAVCVKLIILILAPKAAPGAYLQALRSLATVCLDPSSATVVSDLPTAEKVWHFFNRGGLVLPDYLLVHDIMEPVKIKLNEDDTLEKAIDLFIKNGETDLPVVDKENDLIGVVTTYELLRVCLPDYILWMDDLTPILNFEPFANVLRNESKTWLAEIMTSEYATIAEDAPAIQAAKEITRKHAYHAYVLRGQKLVGVISLNHLLRNIMRD